MKINSKIRYGLRAMIVIANSADSEGVLQKDIAANEEISLKYLDSIILSLKLKGLIVNVKGKGSGYRLTRSAEDISMFDIYTSFEPLTVVDCIANREFCTRSVHCVARNFWCEVRGDMEKVLKTKSLAYILSLE